MLIPVIIFILSIGSIGLGVFCDQTFFEQILRLNIEITNPLYLTYISLFRLGCIIIGCILFFLCCYYKKLKAEWRYFRERIVLWDNLNPAKGKLFPNPPGAVYYSILTFYIFWIGFIVYCFIWNHSLIVYLTKEGYITETLTVLCYGAAAGLAIWYIWDDKRKSVKAGMKSWWL